MASAQQSAAPARSNLAALVAEQARVAASRPQPQLVQPAGTARKQAAAAAQPAPSPDTLAPQALLPGQLSTPELFDKLRRSATTLRTAAIETCWWIHLLHQRADWPGAGYADEEAAREDLGLTSGTWKQYRSLGERLASCGLALDQLRHLTLSSAMQLAAVSPAIWHEYAWLDEARLLPGKQFAALVEERNRQASGATARPTARLALDVPRSQQAGFESRLAKLRKQHKLGTAAATLEHALLAAERAPAKAAAATAALADLDVAAADLARLWPADGAWSTGLVESVAERDARYAGEAVASSPVPAVPTPASLTAAAHATAAVVRRLQLALEAAHALLR